MVLAITDTCMFLATVRDIWDALQRTYSKAGDAAQVYKIKVKTMAAKQGNKTITEYANQLDSLWQELDHFRVIKTKCPKDAAVLKDFTEQDRVYDFLVGLNPEFDQVRIQILGKPNVPCFNEVVALIRSEESRRGLMLEPQITDNSAMLASNNKSATNTERGTAFEGGKNQPQGWKNQSQNRDGVWCTYCKKPRHTREKY